MEFSYDWDSPSESSENDILNQLTGADDTKPLFTVTVDKAKDAASKFNLRPDQIEAFNQLQQQSRAALKSNDPNDAPEAVEEEANDSVHSNGCRPWVGAIKAPTWYKKDGSLSQKPNVSLSLEYIHGYRSKDCRNNVTVLKSGNIVYNTAAVAVILDPKTNTQRFFTEHSDDVTAIAVSQDESLIATGQISDKSKKCPVYILRADTLQIIQKIKNAAFKGCGQLAFSPDGSKLAVVSLSDEHEVIVVDVLTGQVTSKASSGPAKLFSVSWRDESCFATVGEKHLRLWNAADLTLFKRGIWGANKCSTRLISSCTNPVNKDILVGAADGTLQIFKMNTCSKVINLHSSKIIDAITVAEGYILTGGRDSSICVLDAKDYKLLQKIDVAGLAKSSMCAKVRSISLSSTGSLYISTFGSEIYKAKLQKGPTGVVCEGPAKQILSGHYSPNGSWTNEVWGLDLYKYNADLFATVSDDSTLRVWSVSQSRQLNAVNLNINDKGEQLPLDVKNGNDFFDSSKARSVGVSPDPANPGFIVGFKDGSVKYLDNDLKLKKTFKHAKEWISTIKFSPKGDVLAIGSHDNAIYLYSFPQLQKLGKLNKHSSFITHMDFSSSGQQLRSVCGAYDLLFWDIATGSQLTSGATMLRDEEWATHSCIFAWPVQKMWKTIYNDYTDINCVDRSHSRINGNYILANGDDLSTVNLFKWPCVNANAQWIEGKGHSSHVTSVRFTLDDKHLITTGGEDNSICVWRIQ